MLHTVFIGRAGSWRWYKYVLFAAKNFTYFLPLFIKDGCRLDNSTFRWNFSNCMQIMLVNISLWTNNGQSFSDQWEVMKSNLVTGLQNQDSYSSWQVIIMKRNQPKVNTTWMDVKFYIWLQELLHNCSRSKICPY